MRGRSSGGVGAELVEGGVDQNTLYSYTKLSNNKLKNNNLTVLQLQHTESDTLGGRTKKHLGTTVPSLKLCKLLPIALPAQGCLLALELQVRKWEDWKLLGEGKMDLSLDS